VISGDIQGGDSLEELVRQLQTLEDPDMYELALDLKEVIVEGNREGLLAGLDADGVPMAELKESTIKRGRGGFGPPTIPRYSASQLIDRFRAEIGPTANGGVRIKAYWDGVPQVQFFKTGTRDMARRNPSGIRPATRERIGEIIADFKKQLVAKF
jgi:hypothetical protein